MELDYMAASYGEMAQCLKESRFSVFPSHEVAECPLLHITKCPEHLCVVSTGEAHERSSWGAGRTGTLCLACINIRLSDGKKRVQA